MMKYGIVFHFLLVFVCSLWSDTIRVPSDYPTIQNAIDHSVDGDTVLVADGIYSGEGNRNIRFYSKGIVLRSENGPSSCIIDCEGSWNSYHRAFILIDEEDTSSVIEGFTLKNGEVEYSSDYGPNGASIYCERSSPKIQGNIITNNHAYYGGNGGGIYCEYGTPLIMGNIIRYNSADEGGGIALYHSDAIIERNVIFGNSCYSSGGGIFCSASSPVVSGNLIVLNGGGAGSSGGGILVYISAPTIQRNFIQNNNAYYGAGISFFMGGGELEKNTIVSNQAESGGGIECFFSYPTIKGNLIGRNTAYTGGGIACFEYSNPYIDGNTIVSNEAVWGGGAIRSNSILNMIHCIFWENTPDLFMGSIPYISYSDVEGGWEGVGNIDADPRFIGPQRSDYRLSLNSPCIDSGDPDEVDPDRTPRDIGYRHFDQMVPLSIFIVSDTTIVSPGSQLQVNMAIINRWGVKQEFWLGSEVVNPALDTLMLIESTKEEIEGKSTLEINYVHQIPEMVEPGMYRYIAYIGKPPDILYDRDELLFYLQEE